MNRTRHGLSAALAAALFALLMPVQSFSQSAADEWSDAGLNRWWVGAGLGGGSIKSVAPAPAAGSGTIAGSIEVGFRLQPEWGVGVELGAIGPLSGCEEWNCGASSVEFAPNFSRLFAFGEFRPGGSNLKLRAGVGVSRFCYERHWAENAWSPVDWALLMLDEDYFSLEDEGGSGAWRCDASRKALGTSVSIGYDWPVSSDSPLAMGLRLSAEAANFPASPAIGLPKFRHRAVTLSLHLSLN